MANILNITSHNVSYTYLTDFQKLTVNHFEILMERLEKYPEVTAFLDRIYREKQIVVQPPTAKDELQLYKNEDLENIDVEFEEIFNPENLHLQYAEGDHPEHMLVIHELSNYNNTDEKVIGAVHICMEKQKPDTYSLLSVEILEDYQRNGYGKLLVGAAIKIAQAAGMKYLNVSSTDAVEFYLKFGFVPETLTSEIVNLPLKERSKWIMDNYDEGTTPDMKLDIERESLIWNAAVESAFVSS